MENKEQFMAMMSQIADIPHDRIIKQVIPQLLKQLPDELLNKLHFALYVECQERFVAIGDQEPVDKYENIRGE